MGIISIPRGLKPKRVSKETTAEYCAAAVLYVVSQLTSTTCVAQYCLLRGCIAFITLGLLTSGCTLSKAPVECMPLNRYSVGQMMQPFKSRQRSIGLLAARLGEGAVDHGSFGARGLRSCRVQRTMTAPLVLYPSVHALKLSQALEDNLVSSRTLFGRQLRLRCFDLLVIS